MLTIPIQTNNVYLYPKLERKVADLTDSSADKKAELSYATSAVSFRGFSPKYYSAKAYLDRYREFNEFLPPKHTDLYDFGLNRLNGIQEGIKVFEGLNMKEIAFFMRTVTEFGITRGCHNMCSHCYADAKPPLRETASQINKMSWNDFKTLTDGISELNSRLGFYASGPEVNKTGRAYVSPFHDADGLDVVLKDNNGKEHDFIDVSNALYDSVGIPVVFDTAGWTPSDVKMQKRAEKIVEYYSKSENMGKLHQFNISINPFHALHTRQIVLERTGDREKADKFKDLYEKRMANAIFTCTPMLEDKKMGFIQRVATSSEPTFDGFREEDLKNMQKGIIKKIRDLYEQDFAGEQKFMKSRIDVEGTISDVILKLNKHISRNLTVADRGQEFFGKDNRHAKETMDRVFTSERKVRNSIKAKDIVNDRFSGILDSNGQYYLTSWSATFPTEIRLNFENSDKTTAPVKPFFNKDVVVDRSIINNV